MTLLRNPGRTAGLLYIVASIPIFFGLLYVPGRIIVHGDAAATAHNILASETLFRLGIAANLLGQTLFLFVALALYSLLKPVNPRHALAMLLLIVVSIPIAMFNEVNSIAALLLVRGAPFLAPFDQPHRDALAMLLLRIRSGGFAVAEILWGLWLFPLGLLVYRSGFIPRILGVLLMLGTVPYLANSAAALLFPQYQDLVARWMTPLQLVELIFMLWLLIKGATPKPRQA